MQTGVLKRIIEPKQQLASDRQRFSNRDLMHLVLPVVAEQFLALLVGIADTLMVSYAGETAVSGVSLVNQLNNVFIFIFNALAMGGSVVASQYIGSRDRKRGVEAASQLLLITVLISVALMSVMLLFGNRIFTALFGVVEAAVYKDGMTYMRISAYSFVALAVYNSCAGLYRSMGKTKELMYVSFVMNGINVAGNAIGIFVLHAGVAGVAFPSLVSRIFAALVMLSLAFQKKNTLYLSVKKVFSWNGNMIWRILRVAIPGGVENGLFQLTKVALSSIVAMFGTVQIAANGVAQSFWSMAALFCLAMGPVFITVVGQYMGANDMSLHLGLHWKMILSVVGRHFKKAPGICKWAARIVALGIAGYGAYAFFKRSIGSYMFLKVHFVFFAFDESLILFILDYLAVMGLFIFISYSAITIGNNLFKYHNRRR